jgi:hypothetical protein
MPKVKVAVEIEVANREHCGECEYGGSSCGSDIHCWLFDVKSIKDEIGYKRCQQCLDNELKPAVSDAARDAILSGKFQPLSRPPILDIFDVQPMPTVDKAIYSKEEE